MPMIWDYDSLNNLTKAGMDLMKASEGSLPATRLNQTPTQRGDDHQKRGHLINTIFRLSVKLPAVIRYT